MQHEYFALPLALDKVMLKPELRHELGKCSLQQSVIQHLHLLMTTSFGECPGDDKFGCGIWDYDFDNVTSGHKLKEMIRQSLLQVIQEKEKRISNVRVELTLVQEEIPDSGSRRIKKRIDIIVNGILQLTNERFSFKDSFFIGPFSI